MWNRLISLNTNFIRFYDGNNINLIKSAILKDPECIKYYKMNNLSENYDKIEEIVSYAIENGYEIKKEDLEKNLLLCKSKILMQKAIEINASFIKYFRKYDEEIFKYAISMGYKVCEKDLKDNFYLCGSNAIIKQAILLNPNYIRYYTGHNEILIDDAIVSGYRPDIKDLYKHYNLGASAKFIYSLIEQGYQNTILFYTGKSQYVFKYALECGFKPEKNNLPHNLYYSDDIISYLLKRDPNVILKYEGKNESVFELAYEYGFNEYFIVENLENNKRLLSNFLNSKFIMKTILQYDLSIFRKHFLKDLLLAVDVGYIPTIEEILKITNEHNKNLIIEKLIKKDPSLIKYYNGDNKKTYLFALEKGLSIDEKIIETKYSLNSDIEIMTLIIKNNPEYIKYYPYSDSVLNFIIYNKIPSVDEVNKNIFTYSNIKVMKKLIDIDFKYLECANKMNHSIIYNSYIYAFKKGFRPTFKEVIENRKIYEDISLMKMLIKYDFKYLECFSEYNKDIVGQIYDIAFDMGYMPNGDLKNLGIIGYSDKIMKYFIDSDSNYINQYSGTNVEIFKLAFDKGYNILSVDEIKNEDNMLKKDNNIIMYLLKNNDFTILEKVNYQYSLKVFIIALSLGYEPIINEINNDNYNFLSIELLKRIILKSSISECIDFYERISDLSNDVIEFIFKEKNIEMKFEYINILKTFKYDKAKFLINYSLYESFLKELNISENIFLKYVFNIDYNWLESVIYIMSNNKIQEFINIKKYFFDNYYSDIINGSEVSFIKDFVNILINYTKYPELCLYIINNNIKIENEIKSNITFLFNNNDILNPSLRPQNIDMLLNTESIFIEKYQNELDNIENNDIDSIKNILCKLLFNNELKNVKQKLSIYGNTKELRQLLFNNRDNKEIHTLIEEMIIYTSMMEGIVENNEKAQLLIIAKKIIDDYNLSIKCSMLFDMFDEKMRNMYEQEMIVNLTNINESLKDQELLDKEMTVKYGIDIFDFSNKKYCLMYHSKSWKEEVEELVNGISSREKSTICLSIGSNRNQVVYGNCDIIYATDEIPTGSYMRSSVCNMGSNGAVERGSFIDKASNIGRKQRGALEISTAPFGYNSEVLCFREGIKFKYIILPDREPYKEELEVARKYGLKFIKTQSLNKSIDDPQKIDRMYLKQRNIVNMDNSIDELKTLREVLLVFKQERRRIAIFTDAHAMFEPTLAILEDARKQGITEIYSLGDNIGTGPNPKEVIELLNEYGVESLKGNHEMYVSDGIEILSKHLHETGAYEEAKRNSSWTKSKLTDKQLKQIESSKVNKEIKIGGNKILLTHYIKDYNSNKEIEIPSGIKAIFQGHIHFEKKSFSGEMIDVYTLRGAGIGNTDDSIVKKAYYIILTENDEGGYDIEKREIPYDLKSLNFDIQDSDMCNKDKLKVKRWIEK